MFHSRKNCLRTFSLTVRNLVSGKFTGNGLVIMYRFDNVPFMSRNFSLIVLELVSYYTYLTRV